MQEKPTFFKTESGDYAYFVAADDYIMTGFQSRQEAINWAHYDGWDVSHVDNNPGPPNIVTVDRSKKTLLKQHETIQNALRGD
jgi:hypothetical protein